MIKSDRVLFPRKYSGKYKTRVKRQKTKVKRQK